MKAEDVGALDAEARAVDEQLRATDTREEGAAAGAGDGQEAPDAAGQSHGAAGGAPGAEPEPEVIRNPAPAIAAVLTGARAYLRRFGELSGYSPAFADALDDASIAELADALGAVAVKHKLTVPAWFLIPPEETRLAVALGSMAWRVYESMHADTDAGRAARARDVSPGAPGWRDPPNPAAENPTVEPS
jgi:mono/diheme cytochrome c family protein